jgi:hypothetical protein
MLSTSEQNSLIAVVASEIAESVDSTIAQRGELFGEAALRQIDTFRERLLSFDPCLPGCVDVWDAERVELDKSLTKIRGSVTLCLAIEKLAQSLITGV